MRPCALLDLWLQGQPGSWPREPRLARYNGERRQGQACVKRAWPAVKGCCVWLRGVWGMAVRKDSGRCGGRRGAELMRICFELVLWRQMQHECCTCVDVLSASGEGSMLCCCVQLCNHRRSCVQTLMSQIWIILHGRTPAGGCCRRLAEFVIG